MLASPYRALAPASTNIPSTPTSSGPRTKAAAGGVRDEEMNSDTDTSSTSPRDQRSCFCGNVIRDGEGIYCSASCARSDAFSTLCSTSAGGGAGDDWETTHYGRMCRADLRREERKEERRRRRAESNASTATVSSSSISRVPDLVGGAYSYGHGQSHSRNASVASSRTSFSSAGGLSRHPSNASSSSSSRRAYGAGGGVHVDTVIMEDDDEGEGEAEWLASSEGVGPGAGAGLGGKYALPVPPPKYRVAHGHGHGRRRPSTSKQHGGKKRHQLDSFGMGKDMRDVLEEIIQMEKEFVIDDRASASASASASGEASEADGEGDRDESTSGTNAGVFTAVFDRPPRTPSPGLERHRRASVVVPGAPLRGGHRKSMSLHHHHHALPHMQMQMQMPDPAAYRPALPRPPSVYGHSSSLSESHTALYLATASPESASASASTSAASPQPQGQGQRYKSRNSLTFTPEAAGPIIMPSATASASAATPSGRRQAGRPSHSPTMHHPTMSGWRFPAPAPAAPFAQAQGQGSQSQSHSNAATPTRLTINTQNLEPRTPTTSNSYHRQRYPAPQQQLAQPQLLWPPFPTSPENDTPARPSQHQAHRAELGRHVSPPNSGLTLGYLLGSGNDEDVDMMDLDEPHHGPGQGHGVPPYTLPHGRY